MTCLGGSCKVGRRVWVGLGYGVIGLNNYLHGSPVQGWTSLMIVILIIGGIQMLMLGILGEYLWRTYDESRRRPRYMIEYKIG